MVSYLLNFSNTTNKYLISILDVLFPIRIVLNQPYPLMMSLASISLRVLENGDFLIALSFGCHFFLFFGGEGHIQQSSGAHPTLMSVPAPTYNSVCVSVCLPAPATHSSLSHILCALLSRLSHVYFSIQKTHISH